MTTMSDAIPPLAAPLFVVLAFRYGGHSNTFPVGIFTNRAKAEAAAKKHHAYRGGKYDHRIYEFTLDKWDDDIGHEGNNAPCIEANTKLANG
jgi:hypothetical protein